ncbi:ABC transporter permease, partial [Listeria monocytogenes]|nr:ABC transporter permease [Listeria monocytogenes]
VEFKQKSTYYIVKAEGARQDFVEYDINEGFQVISESDYNSLVKEQGTPEKAANLKGNEEQMVLTITYDEDAQKEMVGEKFTLAS